MSDSAAAERAYYFQDLAYRVIERATMIWRQTPGQTNSGNPCGDEIAESDLQLIASVDAGEGGSLPTWREAQARELAFWRTVAFDGYGGNHPLLFPLFQEYNLVSTFYRSGWTMAECRGGTIVEIGCGPLGMIEYLPAIRRVAFDPLNERYARLFARFRCNTIEYLSDSECFLSDDDAFDLGICHNVIDHTDDPAFWFNTLFNKIKIGGRFIFQVNLSSLAVPRPPMHRRLHPSPITFEQVGVWLAAKSRQYEQFREDVPNQDGENYFLAWGTKTHNEPVAYRRLLD